MKAKLLFGLGCVAMLFASCTKDPDEIIVQQGEQLPIQLFSSINQTTASRVNDEGFCNNDGIGIYVVNYQNGAPGTIQSEGNQVDNVRYVYNESENKWTPDYPVYYYDKITPVDIIGYYPYVSKIDNVNTYSFEVAKDQSTDAANGLMGGYEASDFLWGKAENISPTASRVNITFNHKMAGVQVELTEGTGWAENEWSGLDKQVLVSNTIRKATIDLANGDITPVGDVPTTGTVPAKSGDGWRAVVVPQSVGASVALLNITVDGTSYVYRKNSAYEYLSGKLHKFTIEVSKKSDSGLAFKLVGEAITPWESETITHDGTAREYVVINVPVASTDGSSALKAAIEASGKDYTKIKNLKVTGEVNAFDFYFMRDNMPALQSINIEECVIASYKTSYKANVIPDSAFSGKQSLLRIILPNTTTAIGNSSFTQCNLVGVLTIPDSVTSIGKAAFGSATTVSYCNTKITKLVLPMNLQEVGDYAFCNMTGLKNSGDLVLPNKLKTVGQYAFHYCMFGGHLYLPDDLKSLGKYAFAAGGFVGDLIIPSQITEIPDGCFGGRTGSSNANNFTGKLVLPKGLISIGTSSITGKFVGELILPSSLTYIDKNAFSGCGFSGQLIIPESVSYIGDYAFSGTGFNGEVAIPSEIEIISDGIFSSCKNITKVTLHPGIIQVGSSSFYCASLQTVVCKAKTPPTIQTGSFKSEYPISVEVPEESLQKYQQASGWKQLIPSVYRDFNIDNENINALNASFSKKTIVRAPSEMLWSVVHKPDWVTVTPSEGSGKVEVTITFDELVQGGGNRVDSLVFKPTNYDYQKVIKLNQYDCEYSDGDVITARTATVGSGVNVVFMGDCFDAKDIAEGYYKEIMDEAISYLFAIEPYTTYKDYFNVYTVIGHSPDSGLPTTYSINQEAKFSSQYAYGDNGFQFKFNESKCFEYACKAPNVTRENLNKTLVVMIENSNVYGGITRMWGDNSAIAVCSIMRDDYPSDFRGVVQHEVGGHAFGKLADEYIYHGNFIDMCSCVDGCGHTNEFKMAQSRGWYQNLSLSSNIYEVPWSHLIFDPQFSSSVDLYEGGYFHQRGVFRSEPNSCMNNNVPYFSAISREQIVKRIMEYAGEEYTFEKFKSKDNSLMGPIEFTRSMVIPESTSKYSHNKPKIVDEAPVLNF